MATAAIPKADRPAPRAVACVLGDLDLVRPLGLARIACVLVTSPGSPQTRSRLCRGIIPSQPGEIADGAEDLLASLLRFAASQPEPPVLLFQEDDQLLFVSRNRARLSRGFRFAIAAAELVEDLADKGRFMLLAQRLGLPVPPTQPIAPFREPMPDRIALGFPLIAKPLRRRQSWSATGYTAKAVSIASRQELAEWWPRWAQQDMDLLLQEQVPGPETAIESYHVYVGDDGAVLGEFTGRKIRTWPATFGYSTALTTTDASDVAALGRSLVARLHLRGIAKFDFKRAPDGTLHLLEVNPRFNLWHHLGAVAGVNLPQLVVRELTGQPRLPPPSALAGVCWCRLSEDRRAARASGMAFPSWFAWALRCQAKTILWNDPLPFLGTAWHAARRRLAPRLPTAGAIRSRLPT